MILFTYTPHSQGGHLVYKPYQKDCDNMSDCPITIWLQLYSCFFIWGQFIIFLKAMQHQNKISSIDMKLNPRQSPSNPPVLAT